MPFLDKLAKSMRTRDSILCIGLDPEPALIPESLGRGPQAALRFLRRIVRATSDHACCYKPNLAFYERYGSAAFDVLGLTLQAIPADIPVILDAKRGDVPNTSEAYADALFDSFHADAVTVAPYMGVDSIAPFAREDTTRSYSRARATPAHATCRTWSSTDIRCTSMSSRCASTRCPPTAAASSWARPIPGRH